MSQTQAEILALANEIAEIDDDMTEVQVGGGNYGRRLPVGWSVARLVSYIEKGKHNQSFQGKAKDPALEFSLGFALYSGPNQATGSPGYLNDDGTPYIIETFDIARSRNEKARAFTLFKSMNYKGTKKNFAQMLGEDVFLVEIKDYVSKNAKPGTEPRSVVGEVRAGIDVVTGAEYACPPATDLFLFSWVKPTLAAWQKMFIEGTRDDGKSKNWQQEKIAGAIDFKGSPLEALLVANGQPIPKGTPQKDAVPAGAQPAGAAPAGVAAPTQPATPATAPVAATSPAVSPNVAAASVPATPSVAAVAPVASSAPAVVATPVVQAAAPVVPVAAVAAPVVTAPAVSAPAVPAPLAQ